MTARLSDADREYLKRSCKTSGVPEKVEDVETVARLAAILRESVTTAKRDAA